MLSKRARGLIRLAADPGGFGLARRVRRAGLTYLPMDALWDLRERVKEADAEGRPGSIVEAGVALGGSAVVLAASKSTERRLELYDVFDMIPPPSARDGVDVHERYAAIVSGRSAGIAGDTYYGYQSDLRDRVAHSLRTFGYPPEEHNIELIQGLYETTLRPSQVAVAHIDADWYESVRTCLHRIWPTLTPGGVIILDDYDTWSGCREAVDEWLADREDVVIERRSRLHLLKRSETGPA